MEKDNRGRRRYEPHDPTPVEWPLGVRVPETLEQKVARMVRTSVSLQAQAMGKESFEEADDFDVEEEEEHESEHELDDDQERISRDHAMVRRIPAQFRAAFERDVARRAAEQKKQAEPRVENSTVANDLRATVSGASKEDATNGKK